MSNSKNLSIDTPEVNNWVINKLTTSGIKIPSLEGYTVKDDKITSLFERRVSNIDVDNWNDDEVGNYLNDEVNVNWNLKISLSSILNVPLYLVIWKNDVEKFKILKLGMVNNSIKATTVELFETCLELATWLSVLKGITVSKGFAERGRLSFIDNCLRSHGVPWPGNLDGFILIENNSKVKAIFEFSRTRKYPVATHDLNGFFNQDRNRWAVFDTFRKVLNCNAFIIIWSSDEQIIKLQKLKDVETNCLVFDDDILLNQDEIISKINSIV